MPAGFTKHSGSGKFRPTLPRPRRMRLASSSTSDLLQQAGGGALVLERNGDYATASRGHFRAADDALHGPVAALDQHVGLAGADQGERCVVVEPGYGVYAFQGRDDGKPVLERI